MSPPSTVRRSSWHSRPTGAERRFAERLAALADAENRAALAALRRGLGHAPGEVGELYPVVVPLLPAEPLPEADEDVFYLVASLFALHPEGRWSEERGRESRNLGMSFHRMALKSESESLEARFVALLNSAAEDLPDHLRHAVGLLKAHEIPIDWAQLLHDIRAWDRPRAPVQRAWARAFWRVGGDDAAPAPPSGESETDGALEQSANEEE